MNGTEITVQYADGTKAQVPAGSKAIVALKAQPGAQLKEVIAAKANGRVIDLSRTLSADAELAPITASSPEGIDVIRHSTAHLMAQAVKRLYPNVQITIGPVIQDGFYYDFSKESPFTPEDLERIEKTMQEIVKSDFPITREEMPRDQAVEFFQIGRAHV